MDGTPLSRNLRSGATKVLDLGTLGAFLTAAAAFLAALGIKELLMRWVVRKGDRETAAIHESHAVSAVEAQGNLEVLKVLLTETKARVDSYERSISEMRASHSADIRELKTENKSLERQVADLRATLQDYQLGNRTPRGMVLVPLSEVRAIRERSPGLLSARYYPGEHEDPGPHVDVRLMPLPPGTGL